MQLTGLLRERDLKLVSLKFTRLGLYTLYLEVDCLWYPLKGLQLNHKSKAQLTHDWSRELARVQ